MSFFRKICFFIILFSVFFNFNAYSEIVNKIDVQGNERISKETIVIFGDIALGKNYETSDISTLIKKLYDTTFFSNISVMRVSASSRLTLICFSILTIKYPF